MKEAVKLAESDPDVSLTELTDNVYVDNAKRKMYIMQISFVENCTRNLCSPKDRNIEGDWFRLLKY